MHDRSFLAVLVAPLLLGTAMAPLARAGAPDEAAELVAAILRSPNDADPQLVRDLAGLRTSSALDGLVGIYPELGSVFLRREVLRGLALYDDVEGLEQEALLHLMHCASESPERELRIEAIELIGDSRDHGRPFLQRIVDSPADDEVRELAMEFHTANATAADMPWYRSLYRPGPPPEKKKRSRRGDDEVTEPRPWPLGELRLLAFRALSRQLTDEELLQAMRDPNREIRRQALVDLDSSGYEGAEELARAVYEDYGEWPVNRLAAAAILVRHPDLDLAEDFHKLASRKDTGEELALGLADLLAEIDLEEVDRFLVKEASKGKGMKRLVAMIGAADVRDEKLDKTLIKLIRDKDEQIQAEALRLLAERETKEALPELYELLDKEKDAGVIALALRSITELAKYDETWRARLVEYAHGGDVETRNCALELLADLGRSEVEPVLIAALDHPHWATRLVAADGLERMRSRAGVGAIVARLPQESGRMLRELTDVLWRLTGEPFGESPRAWADWWSQEGETFQLVDAARLRELRAEAKERELKRVTTAESFFGIRIDSERVVFIIDVSGSMEERTRGKYVGELGEQRIDVAKRELIRCLKGLAPDSEFNVITFSGDVRAWHDNVAERSPETLEEAVEFVRDLRAGGGTNLYGALRLAFEDPEVDTLYILSDGEPSVGDVVEPVAIRANVAQWNRERKLKIHAIAVGGSIPILEWLAEDAGGTHVRFP